MMLAINFLEWSTEYKIALLCLGAAAVVLIVVSLILLGASKRKNRRQNQADTADEGKALAEVLEAQQAAAVGQPDLAEAADEGAEAVEEPAEPAQTVEEVAEVEEPAEPAETVEEVAEVEEPAEPAETVEEVAEVEEPAEPAQTFEEVAEVEEPAEPAETVEEVAEVEEPAEPAETVEEVAEAEKPAEPVEAAEEIAAVAAVAVEEEDEDEDDGNDVFTDEEEDDGEDSTEIDGIKVFFRYQYSFMARLIQSSAEIQGRYGDICNYVASYSRVKTNISWKQERIYSGRKTLAMLLFKGKKLRVSLALNPADYAESKYGVIDLSEVKRFEKTPVLLKLTSARKVRYAKELLAVVFAGEGLTQGDIPVDDYSQPYRTTEELINDGLVKLLSNKDKVHSSEMDEQISIEQMIRERVTLKEAQLMLTDEIAEKVYKESVDEQPVEKQSVARSLRGEINIDTLSDNFRAHDVITLKLLKEKKLVPEKVLYIKILARGTLDKPLEIVANDFSLNAVKMILLTGGKIHRV